MSSQALQHALCLTRNHRQVGVRRYGGQGPVIICPQYQDAQTRGDQVWSLTQFYSVNFSQSRIGVKKCAFSVVSEATREVNQAPLKGAVSAQKALQGSETERHKGVAGRNRR